MRVIRAFGREQVQEDFFTRVNKLLLESQLRAGKVAAMLNPLTYLVINSGIILILMLGADRIDSGALRSGDVIALVNYISQILVELVKLANLVVQLGKSVAGMGRIGQVLDTPCSMKFEDGKAGNAENGGRADKAGAAAVEFDRVSLRYAGAGAESLTDISFTARRGETIGIIGGTGSGKTSLVNLIPRFYDATGGCVYINGRRITELPRETLLREVAIVEQKPRLFSGTVRSNMLWGSEGATDDEIWSALETAQAAEFVRKKDGGLDEEISQGGGNLSGGQKQRLTIARALLCGADILILDDSASALDYATDAALRRAIAELPKDMTVFIVSQRAGSIMNADKILVLDDGRLVGCGSHAELMENCEIYREIYESQFKTENKTERERTAER